MCQFQPRFAKTIKILETGIDDVLSCMHYPASHRTRISSTNPLERLLEIRRRTRVFCILSNFAACLRLIGMLLVEQNDDGSVTTTRISRSTTRPPAETTLLSRR